MMVADSRMDDVQSPVGGGMISNDSTPHASPSNGDADQAGSSFLEPYEKYKDSGVEWIGEIPNGWQVLYPKKVFVLHKEPAKTGDVQLTSSQKYGIISQEEFTKLEGTKPMSVVSGEDILKHVSSGDFVISMRSFQGGLEYSRIDGRISSAYVAVSPRTREKICPDYFKHLFKSTHYIQALQRTSNLVRDGQALRYSNFAQVFIPVPPLSEQVSISEYLDKKTYEIDDYISDTERSINLLVEYRCTVISEVVTRGLDPDVPMRDSGVEWIGEIPKGWEVVRIQVLANCNSESLREDTQPDYEFEYIDISSVNNESGVGSTSWYRFIDAPSRARRVLHPGDVIVSTVRTYLKAIASIDEEHGDCIASTGFAVLTPVNISGTFFRYALLNDAFVQAVQSCSVGISYPSINSSDLEKLKIPVPPIEQQYVIASYLDAKTAEIDSLVADKRRLVEKLKEYRASLVSEAVTGKFKVPGVA